MKRTSQRSTDFIISFSNNSLHNFFFPLKVERHGIEVGLIWTTYFDGKSANPERRPPHSDHLLGGINLFVFLVLFLLLIVFLCVSYKLQEHERDLTAAP
jgi:hypothetical protein